MLIGAVMVSYYLIVTDINKCTSDPVKFALNKLDIPDYSEINIVAYQNYGDPFPIFDKTIDNPLKPRPNFLNLS